MRPNLCQTLWALALLSSGPVSAQCVPFPVASGGTTECSGNVGSVDTRPSTDVGVAMLPGASAVDVVLNSGRVDVGTPGAGGGATVSNVLGARAASTSPLISVYNWGTVLGAVAPFPTIENTRLIQLFNYGRVVGPVDARVLNFTGATVEQARAEFFNSGTIRRADLCAYVADFSATNDTDGVIEEYLLTDSRQGAFSIIECAPYRITNLGTVNGGVGLVYSSVTSIGQVIRGNQAGVDLDLTNGSTGVIRGPVVMMTGRAAQPIARNTGLIQGGVLLYGATRESPWGNMGADPQFRNEAGGRVGGAVVVNAGRFEQAANAVFLSGASLHPSGMQRSTSGSPLLTGTIAVAGSHTVACVSDDPWPLQQSRLTLGNLELAAGANLTVAPTVQCSYQGQITGPGTLRKSGSAAYIFSGTATHGSTIVQQGLWFANGNQGAVTLEATGILIGIGRIGDTLVRTGGRLAPGGTPGTLTSGSLTMQSPSVFEFEANASASDLLDVVGTVSLGGATLDARLLAGYTHTPGRAMTLIANDGSDPVVGTFSGLAEGAETLIGGAPFRLRYAAGDGNDVVLFALDPATVVSLAPVPGTPNEGAPLTLTATVTGTAPGGAVTFRDGGAPIIGCVDRPLSTSGSSASATCTTSALAGGTRSLSATYSGDNANRSRSSAEVTVTLNRRPTLSVPVAVSIPEDAVSAPVAITVDDSESGAAALTLWASSGDPGLVSDAALTAGLGGSGASRVLAITPVANAFGSTTLTLAASDPGGASRTAYIALTVAPVNDPPSFLLGSNPAHPAGTSGAQSRAGFVSQLSAGPGEAAQSVTLSVSELEDSAGILADATLAPDGRLSYILSGNTGVARLQAIASDDGGTANGGRDGAQREFRIVVGSGADLQIRLSRVLPDPAPGQRAYRILANNNGPLDLTAVSVRGLATAGLSALTWTCSGVCSAASGSGNPNLTVDLAAGAQTEVLLQGSVDAALPFLSLEATISAPAGAPILNPADDRATLVEAAGAAGLLRDGFEPALRSADG